MTLASCAEQLDTLTWVRTAMCFHDRAKVKGIDLIFFTVPTRSSASYSRIAMDFKW